MPSSYSFLTTKTSDPDICVGYFPLLHFSRIGYAVTEHCIRSHVGEMMIFCTTDFILQLLMLNIKVFLISRAADVAEFCLWSQ